jgi:hypothetical protein
MFGAGEGAEEEGEEGEPMVLICYELALENQGSR